MKLLYRFINIIGIILFLVTPYNIYKPNSWFYKSLLIHIGAFLLINTCNKKINSWLVPLIIYLNFFILLFVQYTIDKFNWISFLIILFLLFTFKFNKFKTNCGRLINPDKEWIFNSIILLTIWYSLLNEKYVLLTSKLILIILVFYPLLFPIEEYFIHRGITLSIVSSLSWYLL